ncbi:peptide chain release factor N(5)-glutamine methyltransferase [Candidatus Pelagibacter sp.]|nr:peptide chain release factor N(5)-glutamine methyltransferase [Candidatus Pelagibacter sp.]
MNINLAITEASKFLSSKFIPNSYLDSEILMAKTISKDRNYILLNPTKILKKNELCNFYSLIRKRSLGNPVAYLTNKKFFWNSEFIVTRDTLIPRPDTELVLENVLSLTKQKNKINILDIGIGSGCILLSILKERKSCYGTGIDISKKCINISRINAVNLKISSRLKLFKSDVDKFNLGKYDLIVSNPPYIKKSKIKYLDRNVVRFEPKQALDGGLDGLSEIRKVIKKSSELIKTKGRFILEIGFDQKNKVINLLKKEGFYINSIQKDLAGNDRCIVSTKI